MPHSIVQPSATRSPDAGVGGSLLRLGARMLSPGGGRGRLCTLIFHRVLPRLDPLLPGEPDAATFRLLMCTLAEHFNVLPLAEAVTRLYRDDLPPRAACVTFDDGYADNATIAAPLLADLGLPATVFVATGFLDGGLMFNDAVIELVRATSTPTLDASALGLGQLPVSDLEQRLASIERMQVALKYLPLARRAEGLQALVEASGVSLPGQLMMTRGQVAGLASAGVEVGAHTRHHPILASIDPDTARDEMGGSREELAAITGRPPALFAYPNGKPGRDYGAEHVRLAERLGFEAAVSTAWGVAHRRSDRFQLPRFTPWERAPRRFVARLIQNHLRTRAVAA